MIIKILGAGCKKCVTLGENAEAVPAVISLRDPSTDSLVRLCGNTLRNKCLEGPADLKTVPAAGLHLTERQAGGRQYIRA